MPSLEDLTIGHFRDRVGETFGATAEERALTLTLRSVDALPKPPGDDGREPFSLEFTDPDPEHVAQQTVNVDHADLGEFDLFIVPLGPSADGMRYEAVFT